MTEVRLLARKDGDRVCLWGRSREVGRLAELACLTRSYKRKPCPPRLAGGAKAERAGAPAGGFTCGAGLLLAPHSPPSTATVAALPGLCVARLGPAFAGPVDRRQIGASCSPTRPAAPAHIVVAYTSCVTVLPHGAASLRIESRGTPIAAQT